MAPRLPPANMSFAMGMPVARLFFEPQNTIAISSGSELPRRRATTVVRVSTAAKNTQDRKPTATSAGSGVVVQRPSVTAALKAVGGESCRDP